VEKKVRDILNKPIKTYLPGGLKVCIPCGNYCSHSLVYCGLCGKKFKTITEASFLEILPKIKTGYGIHNTANSVVVKQLLIEDKEFNKKVRVDDIIDRLIKETKGGIGWKK
jgi:hypothetical protein